MSGRWATPAELAGRPLIARAAAAGIAGGTLVAVVAGSFGPRFFATDVRAWGIGIGVLAVVVLLGPLTGGRVFPGTGQLLMVLAVLAVPVAAGGFFLGSLLVLAAGVVLSSVDSLPGPARVVTVPAGAGRRSAALVIDLGLTVVLVVVSATGPLAALLDGGNWVFVLWAVTWVAVTVPAAVTLRATPGLWVAGGRMAGALPRVVLREVLRGALGLGAVLTITVLLLEVGVLAAATATLVVVTLGVLALLTRRSLLDIVTGTRPLACRTVVA